MNLTIREAKVPTNVAPARVSSNQRHRLRVAFIVQRCGREVNGGAEALCLDVARRMRRHWDVRVLTTCALDYMRWDNHYPEGEEMVGDVVIKRFQVDSPRDVEQFNRLSVELTEKGGQASLGEQENWMRAQGPVSTKLFQHLKAESGAYDALIFFGYLYATTYFGLPLVKEKAYLAPLGHDEWPIYLSMWDAVFAMPRGYIFQTPEEFTFLRKRFPKHELKGPVAGIGVDLPEQLDPESFRATYKLRDPFILYVGRVDASKGCGEMFEWIRARRAWNGPPYKLVVIGRETLPVPFHDDILYLGFVPEEEKWDAMAACDWMLLPSRYESLSISLLETWAAGRPAIVNAESEVLMGHCRRANAGLWYSRWDEVEAILASVDGPTKQRLGAQGREYVRVNYSWAWVERDYRRALHEQGSGSESPPPSGS